MGDAFLKCMLSIVREFWRFIWGQKKWWIVPLIIFLLVMAAVLFLTQGSTLSPFMYRQF